MRLRNLRRKIVKVTTGTLDWTAEHVDFEERYRELLSYRDLPQRYDIVLMDSLWGWPRHRVALHTELARLSSRYTTHSRLNWSEPYACDAGDQSGLRFEDFPMTVGAIDNYERMLAQSRLGVFATGFHYGWRNIMTLALMVGLPVLTDRLVVEPWFDMNEFERNETEAFGLGDVETTLVRYSSQLLAEVKRRNRRVFDQYLTPEAMARYIISTATAKA